MNLEQLRLLPESELARLIAEKIMGWQYLEVGYERLPLNGVTQPPEYTSTPELQMELSEWLDDPAVNFQNAVGEYFIHVPTKYWIECAAFCPASNIATAWRVLEKLQSDGYYSQHTDLTPDSGQQWWAWHFIQIGTNQQFSGYADTAPLAICLAALVAINSATPA